MSEDDVDESTSDDLDDDLDNPLNDEDLGDSVEDDGFDETLEDDDVDDFLGEDDGVGESLDGADVDMLSEKRNTSEMRDKSHPGHKSPKGALHSHLTRGLTS